MRLTGFSTAGLVAAVLTAACIARGWNPTAWAAEPARFAARLRAN